MATNALYSIERLNQLRLASCYELHEAWNDLETTREPLSWMAATVSSALCTQMTRNNSKSVLSYSNKSSTDSSVSKLEPLDDNSEIVLHKISPKPACNNTQREAPRDASKKAARGALDQSLQRRKTIMDYWNNPKRSEDIQTKNNVSNSGHKTNESKRIVISHKKKATTKGSSPKKNIRDSSMDSFLESFAESGLESGMESGMAVSYTHLTLPTICSV